MQCPHAKGKPQTSQSDPPCEFSNVQCGQILILFEDPDSREAACSAAIWSNTSGGMSSFIVEDPAGVELLGRAANRIRDVTYEYPPENTKSDLRPLSRVNVISVCHPSVDRMGSTFLASSSKLGNDRVCIRTLISLCSHIFGEEMIKTSRVNIYLRKELGSL